MSTSNACPACEERVIPWLLAYNEDWHGPKTEWSESVLNRFYEDAALLRLFAIDFKSTAHGESSIEPSPVSG